MQAISAAFHLICRETYENAVVSISFLPCASIYIALRKGSGIRFLALGAISMAKMHYPSFPFPTTLYLSTTLPYFKSNQCISSTPPPSYSYSPPSHTLSPSPKPHNEQHPPSPALQQSCHTPTNSALQPAAQAPSVKAPLIAEI